MVRPTVSFLRIAVGGGERHKIATVMAGVVAAERGYTVADMTQYTLSPYRPDLILFRYPASRNKKSFPEAVYWVEVIDTSDPPREWVRPGGEIIKIDISEAQTLDDVLGVIKRRLPP